METDALFGMKTPSFQVVSAIRMYFGGMSLNSICQDIQKKYNSYPSDSTVYKWIYDSTDHLMNETRNYRPEVSTTWVASESVLTINGEQIYIWDIVDKDTCFLLATHLTLNPGKNDAQILMEKAVEKAGTTPGVIIT